MNIIPLVSSDFTLVDKINNLINIQSARPAEICLVNNIKLAVEFFSFEMPELTFINFSDDKLDTYSLLDIIISDPWLQHSGIIGLCESYKDVKKLEEIRGANIIAIITIKDLENQLPTIMKILFENSRILFHHKFGADLLHNVAGAFVLGKDPIEVSCYANLISNFLYNTNRINVDEKNSLNLAIYELLMNALEHGKCGISYDEKSEWLEKGGYIGDLIALKCNHPEIAKRKVVFEYFINSDHSKFVITDDGNGFDWKKLRDNTTEENIFELHGRGILLAKNFTKNLSYNEKGNSVSFEIEHLGSLNLTPALFAESELLSFTPGDFVYNQNEYSDALYYIVSGKYEVSIENKVVSYVTPDDIIIGELSFLLNNRRDESLRAVTEGKLIRISKKEFISALKVHPHYALFLCRILAGRVDTHNKETAYIISEE